MYVHENSRATSPTPIQAKNEYTATPAIVHSKTGTAPGPKKGSGFSESFMTGLYHA